MDLRVEYCAEVVVFYVCLYGFQGLYGVILVMHVRFIVGKVAVYIYYFIVIQVQHVIVIVLMIYMCSPVVTADCKR